jgi:hypothetical protein
MVDKDDDPPRALLRSYAVAGLEMSREAALARLELAALGNGLGVRARRTWFQHQPGKSTQTY